MYEKIKRFYDLNIYSAEIVKKFADKGVISQEQFREIIGNKQEKLS